MRVRCEVDGEKYDRYISGTLLNPEQIIECECNAKPIAGSTLVAVYPVADTEVRWKDAFGDIHTSKLIKGAPFVVAQKFIAEW